MASTHFRNPDDVLDYLKRLCPCPVAEVGFDRDRLMFDSGKYEVVRLLEQEIERQSKRRQITNVHPRLPGTGPGS